MKIKLLNELKEVVTYYSDLKKKKDMGFPITLSDIDRRPITKRVKRIIGKKVK